MEIIGMVNPFIPTIELTLHKWLKIGVGFSAAWSRPQGRLVVQSFRTKPCATESKTKPCATEQKGPTGADLVGLVGLVGLVDCCWLIDDTSEVEWLVVTPWWVACLLLAWMVVQDGGRQGCCCGNCGWEQQRCLSGWSQHLRMMTYQDPQPRIPLLLATNNPWLRWSNMLNNGPQSLVIIHQAC